MIVIFAITVCPKPVFFPVIGMPRDALVGVNLFDVVQRRFLEIWW